MPCDFYERDHEFYMTRKQIGEALEYSNPQLAIDKIHAKHTDRLDKLSVTTRLVAADGKSYDTTLYTRKGIMEICRWSQQPKADAFMDWAFDIIDGLITGRSAIVSDKPVPQSELILQMAQFNVALEKRVVQIEENAQAMSRKVDAALAVFSAPDKDHWKGDIANKIAELSRASGMCGMTIRGRLYDELENTVSVNLAARVTRMRTRMRKQGHTRQEAQSISKLDVISRDAKLRPIFEGIVKQRGAAYAARG